MKPHKLKFLGGAILLALLVTPAFARPLEFSELSLLVRAHDSDSFIVDTVAQRKLLRSLTPQQENTLRAQGASDSLIRALHRSDFTLSQSEAASFEAARPAAAPAPAPHNAGTDRARTNVQIVDVGVDQPINLSGWGGPDVELAFRAPDIVETGRSEAELIDPNSSHVHYATYRGYRVPNWEPVDPEYTSIVAHVFTRPLHIDWRNPVRMNDVPYLLYPVYSFRGASIYFIGRVSDDAVRLAVISH
jgi:hypothetical protein